MTLLPTRHIDNIRRGAGRLAGALWGILLRIPPHAPISLFYSLMPPLLVYLRLTTEDQFGLTVIEAQFGVHWTVTIAVFIVCGWITAQQQRAVVYALAVMPMLLYAMALLAGVLAGDVEARGLNAVVYLIVGALATLIGIRNAAELDMIRRIAKMNAAELAQLRETRGATNGHRADPQPPPV